MYTLTTTSIIAIILISLLVGLGIGLPIALKASKVGNLVIDQTDPGKDLYSFEIESGLSKLSESRYVVLKVKVIKEPQNIHSV